MTDIHLSRLKRIPLDLAIESLPTLIHQSRAQAETEFAEATRGAANPQAFDTYHKNLAILLQVNRTVQQYLNVDVTVKGEDVQSIAAAIKELASK
jgi:hypothetical protein